MKVIRKDASGQYKVHSSSAVIIVLGDKDAYKETERIYEGVLMLGILNKQQYDNEIQDAISMCESLGEVFQRDEAIRNASLSAMMFMLAAKSKGCDTCLMIGYDSAHLKKVLSRRPRGYRKPVGEFMKYV